jgi:exopolysaccharide biosynthesis predicted pyruvyltransferase EpsI
MENMTNLAPKVTQEGKTISFAQFMDEQGGTSEIFNDYIGKMLEVACDNFPDWAEVGDYLVPIAREVLLESAQAEDKDVYVQLVKSIRKAWMQLKEKVEEDQIVLINENVPDVLHVVEGLVHSLRSGWVIKEATFNAAADMRLVIGKS